MKRLLCILLCIAMSCCFVSCDTKKDSHTDTNSQADSIKPGITEPETGYVFEGITTDYGSLSLTITTVGTSGHYFVLDPVSLYCSPFADSFQQYRYELFAEYSYIRFYAHGKSTVEIQIPKGEYRIYYATGENWFGEEELFGIDTVYSEINKTFNFTNTSEYVLSIPDGNLRISKIEAKEFPN